MNDEWYYLDKSGEKLGPFTQSEIINKINSKEISINTLVNSNDLKEWIPLNQSINEEPDNEGKEDYSNNTERKNEISVIDNSPVILIPEKVGGWLWFFCFSQIVLSPVITLYNVINAHSNIDYQFTPVSVIYWAWTETIFNLIICGLGVYVGFSIYKIKENAIRYAQYFLIIGLGYKFISAFLPNLFGLPDIVINIVNKETIKEITRGIFTFIFWYAYFIKSDRVKRTFNL